MFSEFVLPKNSRRTHLFLGHLSKFLLSNSRSSHPSLFWKMAQNSEKPLAIDSFVTKDQNCCTAFQNNFSEHLWKTSSFIAYAFPSGTILVIIFWPFAFFYYRFNWPQVKRKLISIKAKIHYMINYIRFVRLSGCI